MVKRYLPLLLLVLLAFLPAIQTLVSVLLEWYPAITYPALKGLMIVTPLIAWRYLKKSRQEVLDEIGLNKSSLIAGICVGTAMVAGIIIACVPTDLYRQVDPAFLLNKLEGLGLREYYWAVAIVISLFNALFEEYYWRGFLAGQLISRKMNHLAICLAGGLFFGIHHLFALFWMEDTFMITIGISGTVIAGTIWTYMRVKGISLIDCYISHIMADLAVFYVGYLIIQEAAH